MLGRDRARGDGEPRCPFRVIILCHNNSTSPSLSTTSLRRTRPIISSSSKHQLGVVPSYSIRFPRLCQYVRGQQPLSKLWRFRYPHYKGYHSKGHFFHTYDLQSYRGRQWGYEVRPGYRRKRRSSSQHYAINQCLQFGNGVSCSGCTLQANTTIHNEQGPQGSIRMHRLYHFSSNYAK